MAIAQFKPTTFFVHGTYLPLFTPILHLDCREGISHPSEYNSQDFLPKIGYLLDSLNSGRFPLESFYLFGWSGKLSVKARKKAAQDLYRVLKQYPHPITLVCHSHGCNVALNLAAVAQEENDTDFYIDTLILLAGPVQEVTKEYTKSPIFKKIISFYSEGDMFQVIDPQGLQQEISRERLFEHPLFSQRVWPDCSHITQIKVLFDGIDPWHLDFVLEKFIKFLPLILDKIVQAEKETNTSHYCVDIHTKNQTIDMIEVSK